MSSQFHTSGEASQYGGRQRRSKITSYMVAGKRACAGELTFIKPSDLVRLIQDPENSLGETAPVIQLPPPVPSRDTWELWELQFKMRFEWGHSQTIPLGMVE